MPTPDPRSAGEMAERGIICAYCGDYTLYAATDNTSLEHARQAMMAHDAVCPRNPLVARIRELEVAAEARAALLAGAPTVWVATDSDGFGWVMAGPEIPIYRPDPDEPGRMRWTGIDDFMHVDPSLIPPGTVRRYALVPLPEEETP